MVIVLLCLVLLATGVLAGCGKSNTNNNGTNTPSTNTGNGNGSGNGNTGTSEGEASGKLTDKDVTFTIALSENALQPLNPNSPAIQEIYKQTGIKLEVMIIPGSDYATKMNTLLTGRKLPDFFFLWGQPMDIYESGALLPLRELIEKHAPVIQNDFNTIPNLNRTMIMDDIYTLPMIRRDENYEKGTLPIIRMDLLEEQNLEIPKTWDELYTVLAKLRDAYPSSIPYGARGDNRVLVDTLSPLRSMGAHYDMYPDSDGVWKLGRIQNEYKTALEFYNKLYKDKILDNEFLLVDTATWLEGLSSGKYLFFYDNPVFIDQVTGPLKNIKADARFEPLPILENWEGERANYAQPDHYFNQWGISRDVKDPELAIKFWNWLYSEAGMRVMNYGVEGVHYELDANGNPQWKQEILDKYLNVENSFYTQQADIGIGNLSFMSASWLSSASDVFRAPAEDSISSLYIHNMYKDDPAIIKVPVEPPYTAQEGERLKEIRQNINDYSKVELNKFLSGQRPLSEFEAFAQDIRAKGGDEMEQIVNEAEQRFQAAQ